MPVQYHPHKKNLHDSVVEVYFQPQSNSLSCPVVFIFPCWLHSLERAAVNPVISSGPCAPCTQRAAAAAAARWGGSVNTALQGAHMSAFWNISLTLRVSKKQGADTSHSARDGKSDPRHHFQMQSQLGTPSIKKNATKEGKEKKLRLHALKEGVPHLKGYKSVVCFKDECQTEHDLGSEPQSRRLVNCYNLKTATGTQNGGSDGN